MPTGYTKEGDDVTDELPFVVEAPAPVTPTPQSAKKPSRKRKIKNMTVEEAENTISAQLPGLLERLNDLAMGVLVAVIQARIETDSDTGEEITVREQRVYRMPPDKEALKYLTERVLGRVPQRVEIKGEMDHTFNVVPWMPRSEAEKRGLAAPLKARELPAPAVTILDASGVVIDDDSDDSDGGLRNVTS